MTINFGIMIMPVSASDYARLRAWFGAFQALKWTISQARMVLIARRRNGYWNF